MKNQVISKKIKANMKVYVFLFVTVGAFLFSTRSLQAQSCTPTSVNVTPVSCSNTADGSITVTPATCNDDPKRCYSGTPQYLETCDCSAANTYTYVPPVPGGSPGSGPLNVQIGGNQKKCVKGPNPVIGTISFNGNNGTLVICGTGVATFNNSLSMGNSSRLNARIFVSAGSSFSITNGGLDMNHSTAKLYNYGTFSTTGNLSTSGEFHNYGTASVAELNLNVGVGKGYNYGSLTVTQTLNNKNIFTNEGTLAITRDLNLNESVTMLNTCTVTVGNKLTINAGCTLDDRNKVTSKEIIINGNGTLKVIGGAKVKADKMTVSGNVTRNTGIGCSLVEVTNLADIKTSARFNGNISLCGHPVNLNGGDPLVIFQGGASESCTACTNLPETPPLANPAITWTGPGGTTFTGAQISNLAPGSYTMNLSCGNCTYTNTYTVNAPPPLTVTVTLSADQTSATAAASGGNGGYTYTWTGPVSGTGATLNNLVPGTYTVTAKDSKNCPATATIDVAASRCNPTTSKKDITCFGANDGEISIVNAGCSTPAILWLELGATTPTVTNLGAGTYRARITCQDVCSEVVTFTLTQPPALSLTVTVDEENFVTLSSTGGTGIPTYGWYLGDVLLSSQNTSTGLPPGRYEARVTDSKGCMDKDMVVVSEGGDSCSPDVKVTNVTCASVNGKIEVRSSSVCESALITWTNNAGNVVGTGPVLYAGAGVYTLTLLCEECSYSNNYTINAVPPLTVSAVPNGNTATVTITGGTRPFMTTQWVNDGRIVSTSETPTVLPAGTNVLTVIDFNGCSDDAEVVLNTPACSPQVLVTPADCNTSASGIIDIKDGGCGFADSGIPRCIAAVPTPPASHLCDCAQIITGTVGDVTVANEKVCIGTATIANLKFTGTGTAVICGDATITGSVSFQTGSAATLAVLQKLTSPSMVFTAAAKVYNYGEITLSNSITLKGEVYNNKNFKINGTLDVSTAASKVVNNGRFEVMQLTTSGKIENYDLMIVNSRLNTLSGSRIENGCKMEVRNVFSITVGTTIINNGIIDGKGTGDFNLRSGGSTIELQRYSQLSFREFKATGTSSSVATIRYSASSCSKISVSGKTTLSYAKFDGKISYCDATPSGADDSNANTQFLNGAGQNCTCDQSAGEATYTWLGIDRTGPTASGLSKGTYAVAINCPDKCYSVHEYTITAPPALSVVSSASNTGKITTQVSGGTPFPAGSPYTYVWTSSNGEVVAPVANPQLTSPGTYSLLVTDAKNCSITTTVTWEIPPCANTPTVEIKSESCGVEGDGKITVTDPKCSANGTPAYLWSGPGITEANKNSSSPDKLTAGTYTLILTCGNKCSSNLTYEVPYQTAVNITALSVTASPTCNQKSNGSLKVKVEGGSGNYVYQWRDSWKDIGTNAAELKDVPAGIYYVTVADAAVSKCVAEGSISLEEPGEDCPKCDATIIQKNLTCANVPDGTLEIKMNVGGTYNYEWNTGATTAKITNLDAGIYTATLTNTFNGDQCEIRGFVNKPENFEINILGGEKICVGQNLRLEAVSAAPVEYNWYLGATKVGTGPVYVAKSAGSYGVIATLGSCTQTVTKFITYASSSECTSCEGSTLTATVPATNLTCYQSGDGRAEVMASGGSGEYDYVWNTGSTDRILRDVPAGEYSVSITDRVATCVVTKAVTITQPNALQISIQGDPFVCHQSSTMLRAVGSVGTYTWTKSGTNEVFPQTQTITVSSGGTYSVMVRSENGLCSVRSQDFKLEQQPGDPEIARTTSKICPGETVTLTASVDKDIRWSTGETTQKITVSSTGTYTVSVKTGNCEETTESVTITNKTPKECEQPDVCEIKIGIPVVLEDPCKQEITSRAEQRGRERYYDYIDAQRKDFQRQYIAKCLQTQEELTIKYNEQEHHYTLFYYDQAGNLVRTVPPEGVKIITDAGKLSKIKEERAAGTARTVQTEHDYLTTYRYNSNNSSTGLLMPDHVAMTNDDKVSQRQWYDELGRLVLSQNSFHQAQNPKRYQYVIYDKLGREIENGEVRSNVDMATIQHAEVANRILTDKLTEWITPLVKYEVHRNYYDQNQFTIAGLVQENLRNRLASATYEVNDADKDPLTYDNAIHYSYDVHGNVKEQVTDYPELEHLASRYKSIKYVYDLVSQNVIEMHYQKGKLDQYYYRNEYDADNRLVQTWTSKDYIHWDRDAKQFFYEHGPLARTEIGHEKVQGVDYAYTIQGWIKGVNSNILTPERDMGHDGLANGLHRFIPKDEMGYSLGFFKGDYASIDATNNFLINTTGSELETKNKDLYNGNISNLITSINEFMKDGKGPLAQTFRYDQLNRLTESRAYEDPGTVSTNAWAPTGTATDKYMTKYKYDANGNILTLKRNAHVGTTTNGDGLDDLVYKYENKANGASRNTNKLISVEEKRNNSANPELQQLDDIKP